MTKFIKLPTHVQEMIEAETHEIINRAERETPLLVNRSSFWINTLIHELKEAKATAYFREMELIELITELRKEVENEKITEEWLVEHKKRKNETRTYMWHWRGDFTINYDLDDNTIAVGQEWLEEPIEFIHEMQNLFSALKLNLTPSNHEPKS